MHILRKAMRRSGPIYKVDLLNPTIKINAEIFNFEMAFTAKQFGDDSSEYEYHLHGDLTELLEIFRNNFSQNKTNAEEREKARKIRFKIAVDTEVQKQLEHLRTVASI